MNTLLYIFARMRQGCRLCTLLPLLFVSFVTLSMVGCKQSVPVAKPSGENMEAKQKMQGIWVDEDEGTVIFRAKGDTIYYPDSVSQPVHFHIVADSLIFDSSHPMECVIKLLTDNSLRFINSNGDEIHLQKSNDPSYVSLFEKATRVISVNQGKLIKRDTVMTAGDVRYHAYVQVNPTTYKVYKQSLNEDGVSVDNAYYDNIIHLALYENSKAIINKDYRKQDFASLVPQEFIRQCVFSDIEVNKADKDGVHFVAILSIPDTYTCYNVNIFVSRDGHVDLSL